MFAESESLNKLCRKCGRTLPATLEHFTSDKSKPSGLHSVCRDCNRRKSRLWRDNNIEAARAADRARYAEPERSESTKRRASEHYTRNREDCILRATKRCKSLAELGIPRVVSERAIANQKIRSSTSQKRRNNAEGTYTAEDVIALRKTQKGLCCYCSRPISIGGPLMETVDHIIPLSKGGTHWPHNLALACLECNLIKHNRSLSVFLQLKNRPNKNTPIIPMVKRAERPKRPKRLRIYTEEQKLRAKLRRKKRSKHV